MNSLMLLVAKILGVKSEGADSDVFALMEGAMNVMGIHNLLPQSARRVDIAEVATELLSGGQILIRTAGSKERFYHGIFVGPISGVQGGKNLVVDFWGSQDAGKQEAKIRLRTLGEFMAVPGCPELADPSFKEESNASEEPMTTTVEDYDALLRELENCRIKNQTLIKHNDELKLISETTMHENILLKTSSAAVKSAYDRAVSASNQTYGIGSLDSEGNILLSGNLRISETANIFKEEFSSLFVNFTGQHRCFVDALAPARLRDHEGLVVVTDKNAYASGLLRGRQRAMTINQALPIVSLSKVPKDPRAFGVISLTQDHPAGPSAAISSAELRKIAEQGDVRVQINSLGEGCIWVCDETGSTIHAGDYVTTSSLSGYASLQVLDDGDVPDGTLRNYTVAKLTMDCDFSQPLVDVEEVQKDEYGNVVFDADGSLVYTIVTTTQGPSVVDPDTGETRTGEPLETPIPVTEPAYEMRWMTTEIDASSGVSITTLISKEDYETSVDNVSLFSVGDMVMYSDIRTKSDVLPIPDALERVGRLRGKRGVACPLLDQYCGNRTEVLGDIDADAALGKTAVLSVMNGSKTAVYKHQDSVWLRDFQNEMNQARDEIMAPGGADEFYIDIARKDRNTYASAVNLMLCDLENECLMAMLEYLDKKSFKVGVLVFDGAMVEKKKEFADSKDGGVTQEMLDEASDYVWDRTGYRLQIKIKDMTIDMLDVPASAYMGAPVHAPRYAGGDDVAAKILLKDLGGKLVKSKGVVFGKHGDVWTNDKDVVESFMFTACQRANIKFVDESGISRKYSCLYTKAINIVKTAKHYIPVDDNFVKKIWESNLGVLCFRNGVFRFRDKSFAPFSERPEVMPVIVIDRDFPSERPTDELLEHVKEKVLVSTLGEEGRVNTYLQMIARSMAAKHQDKQWGMLIGERNSGKGLLQALNERAWGQYVNTIDSSVLMLNNFTNDVKSQGWMIECEFTRQTYTNEIKVDPGNKHIKLDGGLIKKFQSGGDVLKARQLYENERALKSASRLFMNLNDLPEISAVDALDTVVVIEFPHKFVNPKDVDEAKWLKFFRPADPSLKDGFCAREDVRDAFIWLVIDAFDQEQPLKISDVVRRDTEKLRMDEGDELSLINAHFKITTDLADVVTVADVNEFAKDKKMKTRGLRGS
eukprot:gene2115-biopygen12155